MMQLIFLVIRNPIIHFFPNHPTTSKPNLV